MADSEAICEAVDVLDALLLLVLIQLGAGDLVALADRVPVFVAVAVRVGTTCASAKPRAKISISVETGGSNPWADIAEVKNSKPTRSPERTLIRFYPFI